jgi:hypothetical protein
VRIALVMSVRDERALLRANLLYHRHLGAERCFVFDDGSADGTAETVRDLPWVQVAPSVDIECFRHRPELDEFVRHAASHSAARQSLNAMAAKDLAREAGFDWLISLDADELACPDLERSRPGQLQELLAGVPPEVQVVRLTTLEVAPRRLEYAQVFAEETLFLAPGSRLRRRLADPASGRVLTVRGFLGHTEGKSAIRPAVPARPRTTHHFVRPDGQRLPTVRRGYLLHYYCYSASKFAAKWLVPGAAPDAYVTGKPIDPARRVLRDAARHLAGSPEALREYYRRWVMLSEREGRRGLRTRVLGLLPRRPDLVEVPAVRQAFAEMGAGAAVPGPPG